MNEIDVLKSRNGKRKAIVTRYPTGALPPWVITLEHSTRTRSSIRERRTRTKGEAMTIAKEWIAR